MEEEGLGDLDNRERYETQQPQPSSTCSSQLLAPHIKPETAAAFTFIRAENSNSKKDLLTSNRNKQQAMLIPVF